MATSNANVEVKLNKSDQNIGMQLDQDQLTQITHLINNLQNQQVTINSSPTNVNMQQSNITAEGLNDLNSQQQQFQIILDNESSIIDNQVTFNPIPQVNNSINQFQQAQLYNQLQSEQQQQQQQEYHPIMLNGQPALFIPASSAISSNLLSQMMMSNQSNENKLEAFNPETSNHTMNSQPMETINLHENLNSNTEVTNQNNNLNLCNDFNVLANGSYEINNFSNVNNVIGNLENMNQNQVFFNGTQIGLSQQNVNQQLICVQQDGNIKFQQVPLILSQNQNITQQNIEMNNSSSECKPNKLKKKLTPIKTTKQNTVASALANSSNITNTKNKASKKHNMTNLSNLDKPNENLNMDQQVDLLTKTIQSGENDEGLKFPVNVKTNDIKIENINSMSQDKEQDSEFGDGVKKRRKACDCPNCKKWRSNHNSLTIEELAKKRTHNCHKCPKEYNKTSHLRAHLRAHDNYRPYKCDFTNCGKSFTRSDELKRHKRIHNDDRNFLCKICKKKFLRSDHLNKHLLTHNKTQNQGSCAVLNPEAPDISMNDMFGSEIKTERFNEQTEETKGENRIKDADGSPFTTPAESPSHLQNLIN